MLLEDLETDIFSKINIPQEDFDNLDNEDAEDLLDDLQYIFIDQNTNRKLDEVIFYKGIADFRKDCNSESSFVNKIIELPKELPNDKLSEEEIKLLNTLTSLDGDFKLESYPIKAILSNSLLRKVLIYRLNILGLITITSGNEIQNINLNNALGKLKTWTFIFDDVKILALTGNIPDLILSFLNRESIPGSNFHDIVYFQNKIDNKTERTIKNDLNKKSFTEALSTYSSTSPQVFQESWKKKDLIKQNINDEVNQFVARLIQIRLWMLGTYEGKLDSDLGAMSLDSFESTLQLANQIVGQDRFQYKWLLSFKIGGYWAINIPYLVHAIMPVIYKEELSKVKGSVTQELLSVVEQAPNETDKNSIYEDLQNQINDYNIKERQDLDGNNNVKKRRKKYKNNKGLFGIAKEFFKKLKTAVGNFLKKALDAIKSFFNFIKNGIRNLIQEIKKAINDFKEGIQFVFSKRIIQTDSPDGNSSIKTTFDLDFDAVTEVENNPNQETINTHQNKCEASLTASYKSFNFLEKVMPVVLNALKGPVGWVKLGFMILKEIISFGKKAIGLT